MAYSAIDIIKVLKMKIECTQKICWCRWALILVKCTHACNVRSVRFLDVKVCLRGAKILCNSPPYFRTSASPVCMQKVVVLILKFLFTTNTYIPNDELIQPGDFSHLNIAYTILNFIRKYCNRLVTQKCPKKDHVFF